MTEDAPDISWIEFEDHGRWGLGRRRTVRYERLDGPPIIVQPPAPWWHPKSYGTLAIYALITAGVMLATYAACLMILWVVR